MGRVWVEWEVNYLHRDDDPFSKNYLKQVFKQLKAKAYIQHLQV